VLSLVDAKQGASGYDSSDPDTSRVWWKEVGVLKAMEATHETGNGFAPGLAQTVTIDDPVLLDRVLDMAAEDADAGAIMAAMLAEAEKAEGKRSGGRPATSAPPATSS